MHGWYTKEECLYDYNSPGFSAAVGHFTQAVWSSSLRIGCAAENNAGAKSWFWACHFYVV